MSNHSIHILRIFFYFIIYAGYHYNNNTKSNSYSVHADKKIVLLFYLFMIYAHYYKLPEPIYNTLVVKQSCHNHNIWKFLTILQEVFFQFTFHDLLYYLTHRFIFHSAWGLKYIHSRHHEYRIPNSISTFYANLSESIITYILIFVPSYLFPVEKQSLYLYVILWLWININNHSGIYWNHHKLHHLFYIGNYGITSMFDAFFNTHLHLKIESPI